MVESVPKSRKCEYKVQPQRESLPDLEAALLNRQATPVALGPPVEQAQADTKREPEYRSEYTEDAVPRAYNMALLKAYHFRVLSDPGQYD